MAGEPNITVVGNLTADPATRTTQSGQTVANFTVASTPRVKDGDNWKDGETTFFRCSAWGDHAEQVAAALQKGQRVIVTGRLASRSYETDDGTKRTDLVISVDEIGAAVPRRAANTQRSGQNYQANPQERHVGAVVPQVPDTWDPEVPF